MRETWYQLSVLRPTFRNEDLFAGAPPCRCKMPRSPCDIPPRRHRRLHVRSRRRRVDPSALGELLGKGAGFRQFCFTIASGMRTAAVAQCRESGLDLLNRHLCHLRITAPLGEQHEGGALIAGTHGPIERHARGNPGLWVCVSRPYHRLRILPFLPPLRQNLNWHTIPTTIAGRARRKRHHDRFSREGRRGRTSLGRADRPVWQRQIHLVRGLDGRGRRAPQTAKRYSQAGRDNRVEAWTLFLSGRSLVGPGLPGSVEFSYEMEGALAAVDLAIVVCEPSAGPASSVPLLLKALEDTGSPTLSLSIRSTRWPAPRRDARSAPGAFEVPLAARQLPIRESDAVTGYIDVVSGRAYRYGANQGAANGDSL